MKIYLSYKQTWVPKEQLEKELLFFKKGLEKLGHEVFIYYFDWNLDLIPWEYDKLFLENIKKSDLVLAYINYPDKSEGQLLELGMAYALWKEIKLLINGKVKDKYYLIFWLGKVVYFDNLENISFNDLV